MLKCFSITKRITDEAVKKLNDNNIEVIPWDEKTPPTEEELGKIIEEYDISIIGIKQNITYDMVKDINKHKIICTLSKGSDHIEREVFNHPFIHVKTCSDFNTLSCAEHIFSLIFALNKQLFECERLVINKQGFRENLKYKTREITGKTLGLIGAGKISRKVIDIFEVFNMKILCYTLYPELEKDLEVKGVEFVDLDFLLKNSDIISINIPLDESTENMISREKIELLRADSIFINTARAEITDIEALVEYADKNPSFSLGLDIDTNNYIDILGKQRDNIIVTPHIAGITVEAGERSFMECADNIIEELNSLVF